MNTGRKIGGRKMAERRRFLSFGFLFVLFLPIVTAEPESADDCGIPHVNREQAREAVAAAVEVFNGFRSKDGKLSLLDLKLQKNTIAGILHNLIGKELAERATYWSFKESGATGGDLMGDEGEHLELKTSSGLDIKGNQVSHNDRYYLASNFVLRPDNDRLVVVWIRAGRLAPDDWRRPKGTQWAFLNEKGEAKLKTVWKNFGDLLTSQLPGIGEARERRLAKAGIHTVRQVAEAELDVLCKTAGMSETQMRKAQEEAKRMVGE